MRGYTLIEIVIVIAIIGIMALFSVPVFNNYEVNNNLEAKAQEIVTLFNQGQALSQSPIRRKDSSGREYNCDASRITYYKNGTNHEFLLRLLKGGADCVDTDDNIVRKVIINDNPKLAVLSIDDIISAGTGTVSVVKFELNSITLFKNSFVLKSIANGLVKTKTFTISDVNEVISIKYE